MTISFETTLIAPQGKKKEVLVGENSLQKSCISAFCTYLL